MAGKTTDFDTYFKSEEHKIIFALLYTDTALRRKILKITEELYMNADKAKKWRNRLLRKIHPDVCDIIGADEAIKKINELYVHMTEKSENEDE